MSLEWEIVLNKYIHTMDYYVVFRKNKIVLT